MMVMATPLPLSLGGVFDLSIRFGNQVRAKCCTCQIYISVAEPSGIGTCHRCHTTFLRQCNGMFKVVPLI